MATEPATARSADGDHPVVDGDHPGDDRQRAIDGDHASSDRSSQGRSNAPKSEAKPKDGKANGHDGHQPGSHAEDEVFDPAEHRPSKRTLYISLVVGVVAIVALVLIGVIPRIAHDRGVISDEQRAESAVSRVVVTTPKRSDGHGVSLPSSVQPLRETIVYARTNGYVRRWYTDIGEPVKAGQTLATIDTPEVDQELRQSEAALAQARAVVVQAKAQQGSARTTKARYDALAPSGIVSKQDFEDKNASFDVQNANVVAAEASVRAAEANVKRYQELKSFSVVVAPFDGVVTSRTTENGQLVSAGSSAGQALFKVAKVDVVRLFINVPQIYAPTVKVGQIAKVQVREFPDRIFLGKVERTARELDPSSRTLLTEVDINNADGALISGMYAQVRLDVNRRTEPLLVPATALSVTSLGTRVATVVDGTIKWKVVDVENDLGDQMAISTGLDANDVVVVMPGEKLVDGLKVETQQLTQAPQGAPAVAKQEPVKK